MNAHAEGATVRSLVYGYTGTVVKVIGRDHYLVNARRADGVEVPVEAPGGHLVAAE
ncbi:hypothetical protein HOS58_gp43 [Streptomyces phage Attoomi]|uniref:Uncharacterized protein n=1 Tax=Streptomyces phage Attoomi TaxID=2059881 RepID=A0A2H5BLN3_9CAUD|nr:hypothetical protein HOS58_gp43 [Streptomyces phage Attoomi]AUG87175.1 hypothetical protein SEA_ATTOOMI_43 [Streptomyces phage Attoomi]